MTGMAAKFERVPDYRLVPLCERFLFYEFFLLERHRREVAASLARSTDSNERFIEDLKAGLEDDDPYWDTIMEDHHEQVTLLPHIQWSSQFLIAYSTFEHVLLNAICTRAQGRLGLAKSHSDYSKHRGIERARIYLKDGGITAPFRTPEWTTMKDFGVLRNSIAHSGGEIDLIIDKGRDLRRKMSRWPGIDTSIDENGEVGYIKLTSEFLEFAIEAMRRFAYSVANVEVARSA